MALPPLPIIIREATREDWHYILKTLFYQTNTRERWWAVRRRGAAFIVAAHESKPDIIVGFLSHEKVSNTHFLHFAHTHYRYRQNGIFRSLLAQTPLAAQETVLCTHWSRDIDYIAKHHIPALTPVLPCVYKPKPKPTNKGNTHAESLKGNHQPLQPLPMAEPHPAPASPAQ